MERISFLKTLIIKGKHFSITTKQQMSAKIPTVRQIAWISIIPQLLVMGLIFLIWYQFDQLNYILHGAITYLIISQLLRRSITHEHRKGMSDVQKQQFNKAIPHFQNSYQYFSEHEWIDNYRYLTLLSSGKMTYREMALINIAFCYGQIGNGNLSKEYYQKTLEEFPDNAMAEVALKLIDSAATKDTP